MERPSDTIDPERSLNENMIRGALEYLKLGYSPLPLVPGQKGAIVKWRAFQTRKPTQREIETWFSFGERNIGLVTGNGLVVVDVDDSALLDAVIEHCGD